MGDEEEEDDGHEDDRQVVLQAAPVGVAHRPAPGLISDFRVTHDAGFWLERGLIT